MNNNHMTIRELHRIIESILPRQASSLPTNVTDIAVTTHGGMHMLVVKTGGDCCGVCGADEEIDELEAYKESAHALIKERDDRIEQLERDLHESVTRMYQAEDVVVDLKRQLLIANDELDEKRMTVKHAAFYAAQLKDWIHDLQVAGVRK